MAVIFWATHKAGNNGFGSELLKGGFKLSWRGVVGVGAGSDKPGPAGCCIQEEEVGLHPASTGLWWAATV